MGHICGLQDAPLDPAASLGRRPTGGFGRVFGFLPGEEFLSKLPGVGKHCRFAGECALRTARARQRKELVFSRTQRLNLARKVSAL